MCFFFQAEDGIRDLVRSRGLGDVYKRQRNILYVGEGIEHPGLYRPGLFIPKDEIHWIRPDPVSYTHLTLPTSDLV